MNTNSTPTVTVVSKTASTSFDILSLINSLAPKHNTNSDESEKTKIISYVINMKRNPERLVSFARHYFSADLNTLARIDGIDGKKINIKGIVSDAVYKQIETSEKVGFRVKHYQLTRGAVGCYLSHIKAYQTFLGSDGYDYALIFEDDAVLHPETKRLFLTAFESLPKDWDMALLGCTCRTCTASNSKWNKVDRFWGLHAYAINRASAQKVLDLLLSIDKIYQQLDSQFSDYARSGQLVIYCCREKLVDQNRNFDTTIQLPVKRFDGIDANENATPA